MAQGKRYDGKPKLNIKKVLGFLLAIIVIIMVITSIQKLLKADPKQETKTVNVNYYPVYTNGKWGVIDTNGDTTIDPTYEEMIVIPNNEKPVFICTYDLDIQNGTYKTKVLNEKNQPIFTDYSGVTILDNHDSNNNIWYEKNMLKVSKDGKYGVINFEGKEIVKCEYDEITAVTGITNTLLVKKDNKYGIINSLGLTVINPEYVSVSPIGTKADDGYIIRNENGFGIATTSKKIIIEPQYKEVRNVSAKDLYVVKSDKWQLVDKENKVVLKDGFDSIEEINGENLTIKKGEKFGVIKTDGTTLIPTEYSYLKYAFDNYYIVQKDGKYGLVDTSNNTKMKIIYQNMIYRQDAGFIEAENDSYEAEVYDKNIVLKLTGIISEVNVEDGYLRIWKDNDYKYYNFKFEEKTNIEVLKGKTLYLSKKDGKYGYVDKNGNVVVEYNYDDAKEQNPFGFCAVKKDGKWGALDKQGKLIQEPKYALEKNTKFDFIAKWHIGRDINMNYYTDAE